MRYAQIFIAIWIWLEASHSGFSQFKPAFHYEHPVRMKSCDTIFIRKLRTTPLDSLPYLLHNLKELAEKHRDQRCKMLYEMYYMFFQVKKESFNLDSSVNRVHEMLGLAKKINDSILTAHILTRFGDILGQHEKQAMSIAYYSKAFTIATKLNQNVMAKKRATLAIDLAKAYYKIGDYDMTEYYLSQCDYLQEVSHTSMLGYDLWSQVCLKKRNFKKSFEYIEKAESIYEKSDTLSWFFNGWRGVFIGNKAKIKYEQNEFNSAIPLFEEAISITQAAKMYNNIAQYGILLAESYIHSDQWSKLNLLIPRLQNAVQIYNNNEEKYKLYKLLLQLSTRKKDLQAVSKYLDSLQMSQNKKNEEKESNNQLKEQLSMELKAYQRLEKDQIDKIKKESQLKFAVLTFMTILLSAGLISLHRKQMELKQQKKLNQLLKEYSEMEIAQALKELEEFKEKIKVKNTEIEWIEKNNKITEKRSIIENLKQRIILTEENWIDFKILFERVHQGYIEKIKTQYPNLTQGEMRYFLLTKIGLNNKEMANLLGVSPGALRTIKSRMSKKYEMKEVNSDGN